MIIMKDNSSLVSKCNLFELVSDHYTQIDLYDFMSDIRSNFKQDTSIPLIDIFNNCLEMTLNEHAPLKSLLITERINNHWYNDTFAYSKRTL